MNSQFASLDLPKPFLENIASLGFDRMTPIQSQSIPKIMEGNDVIAQAKTGSGKTAAFGVGLLWNIKTESKTPSCLVLSPTRELAEQICVELRKLARRIPNVKILNLTGGVPIGPQFRSLEHGANIIVGTPGRVLDHLRKNSLRLNSVEKVVLDEADRMLDMGFLEDIESILELTPQTRQTLLFSATYPEAIETVSGKFQNNPIEIKIDTAHQKTNITQHFVSCENNKKLDTLKSLIFSNQISKAVVFCQTKVDCDEVAEELSREGIITRALHGDMEQRDREEVLTLFANGSLNLLTATDVAARGIDIKELPAVVNFELSRDPQVHTHRIGRTGRAGKAGVAFSIVAKRESRRFERLQEDNPHLQMTPIASGLKDRASLPQPDMVTLLIAAGKRNKLRPGDVLGALTQGASIHANDVGQINVFPVRTYVAVNRSVARRALDGLRRSQIKGRTMKVYTVR